MSNITEHDIKNNNDLQSSLVIQQLVEKGMNPADATKTWYNSKTRYKIQETDLKYLLIAPTRCFDELEMELSNNPHWMQGQFE